MEKFFWNATMEIDNLKKTKDQFSFISGDKKKNPIITSLGDLLAILKNEWTRREKEIIQLYDKIENQQELAKKLKISQQSVSDGLIRSKYKRIRESEKVLIEFLQYFSLILDLALLDYWVDALIIFLGYFLIMLF